MSDRTEPVSDTDTDADADTDADVAVVGAGITGLALTHHLAERAVDVVTFEASDRAGGVIRSVERDGTTLEVGPQRLRLTDGIATLVAAAGIGDATVRADADLPLYVYADGRLREVPRSVGGFLRTDLLSWGGKLRVLAEPLTGAIRPSETARSAFVRKFGTEAYENLIRPLYGGIYGSDPAEMPAEHALDALIRLESDEGSLLRPALRRARAGPSAPAVTFEGGNRRLPEALAATHADRVRLGAPVTAVRGGESGYVVETPTDSVAVEHAVLTVPAAAAADLLAGLPTASAEGLADLRYNSLAYAYLRSDADVRGLGYQVRRDEPVRTLGVTWNGSAFGRDSLFTAFLGGMADPTVLDRDPATIGRVAAEEFETVVGAAADVLDVVVDENAIPAHDRSWTALDGVDLPDGIRLATNYTGRVGVPGRVREARRVAAEIAGEVRDGNGD